MADFVLEEVRRQPLPGGVTGVMALVHVPRHRHVMGWTLPRMGASGLRSCALVRMAPASPPGTPVLRRTVLEAHDVLFCGLVAMREGDIVALVQTVMNKENVWRLLRFAGLTLEEITSVTLEIPPAYNYGAITLFADPETDNLIVSSAKGLFKHKKQECLLVCCYSGDLKEIRTELLHFTTAAFGHDISAVRALGQHPGELLACVVESRSFQQGGRRISVVSVTLPEHASPPSKWGTELPPPQPEEGEVQPIRLLATLQTAHPFPDFPLLQCGLNSSYYATTYIEKGLKQPQLELYQMPDTSDGRTVEAMGTRVCSVPLKGHIDCWCWLDCGQIMAAFRDTDDIEDIRYFAPTARRWSAELHARTSPALRAVVRALLQLRVHDGQDDTNFRWFSLPFEVFELVLSGLMMLLV